MFLKRFHWVSVLLITLVWTTESHAQLHHHFQQNQPARIQSVGPDCYNPPIQQRHPGYPCEPAIIAPVNPGNLNTVPLHVTPHGYTPVSPGSPSPMSMPWTVPDKAPNTPVQQTNPQGVQPGQTLPGLPNDPSNLGLESMAPEISQPQIDPSTAIENAGANSSINDSFALTSEFGGGTEGFGSRDITIGDFFINGSVLSGISFNSLQNDISVPIAGGDRRYKVSDHFSPIPINRNYFSYHMFGDAVTDANGNQVDVQRYTFGIERTFMQGNASFEVRVPFVHGLDTQQVVDGSTSAQTANKLGNLTFATKYLLIRQCNHAVTAGWATTLPTASDGSVSSGPQGNGVSVRFENQAVEFIPFISYYVRPTQNSWMTLSSQLDFNIIGNDIVSTDRLGNTTRQTFNDQNLFALDFSVGHWFCYCPGSSRFLQGFAPIFELHYTTTMNDTDDVIAGDRAFDDRLFNPFNRQDILNSTLGFRTLFRGDTFLTTALVFPLRSGTDREFETELNFNLSRAF